MDIASYIFRGYICLDTPLMKRFIFNLEYNKSLSQSTFAYISSM